MRGGYFQRSNSEVRWFKSLPSRKLGLHSFPPPATEGWPVDRLAKIVTQDAMIGASRLDEVKG